MCDMTDSLVSHTATHCNALQHTATYMHRGSLYHVRHDSFISESHCNALQRTATHCQWRAAAWCRVSQSPVRTASCALFAHEHRISVVLQQCLLCCNGVCCAAIGSVALQRCLSCCNSVCCAAAVTGSDICSDSCWCCSPCWLRSLLCPSVTRTYSFNRNSGEKNLHCLPLLVVTPSIQTLEWDYSLFLNFGTRTQDSWP